MSHNRFRCEPPPADLPVWVTATVYLGTDKRFYVREEVSTSKQQVVHGPVDCPDVANRLAHEVVALVGKQLMLIYGTSVGRAHTLDCLT